MIEGNLNQVCIFYIPREKSQSFEIPMNEKVLAISALALSNFLNTLAELFRLTVSAN